MEKIHNVREMLIHRYSNLKNESVDKATARLNNMTIDDIMDKQRTAIRLSIVLVVLVTVTLIIQVVLLYRTASHPSVVLFNVLFLILCLKGLHDNHEIKQILKLLKEVGLK